jgi:CRISPR-associated endonuclease Csn1
VGQYLARRHDRRLAVRVRLHGQGKDAKYEFYPQRGLIEEEFHALWAAQAKHHPELTDATRDTLHAIMFRQRPLKPVIPGRCTLNPDERRAPWALPLAQKFRIYQELANLRIERFGDSRPLDHQQRDAIFAKLEHKQKLTFEQMRRAIKLDATHRFNLESPNREGLKGDETGIRLAKPKLFADAWWKFDANKQNSIVETILAMDDDAALAKIAHEQWGLSEESARAVARVGLPNGHAAIGKTAMGKIVPIMVEQGLGYHDAAKAAGYEPSDFRGDGSMDALPYYGEILDRSVVGDSGVPEDPIEKRLGRFPNPTVHIALNQLRVVVNTLAARHGKPHEVVIELARELKQNRKQKDDHNKRILDDTKRNQLIAEKLAQLQVENNALNRKTYKLWEELGPPHDRRCVYTNEPIAATMIFSGAVAIDHILPFSATLDDGMDNLLLCMASANRQKTNMTPFQWKGSAADWDDILKRAENLPQRKRRRFAPDGMEWWLREESDFIARHLTDTQWIAKAAKEYIGGICHSNRVWATPGRLTALLRGKWGLNAILQDVKRDTRTNDPEGGETTDLSGVAKNRDDHRHHAIDAFVIALTERGMLNKVSRAAGQTGPERIIDEMPEPWPGFRDALRARIANMVVSLKPDHGRQGRLHEDTAYGFVKKPEDWGGHNVVYRKSFADLNQNEVERIRDPDLRRQVTDYLSANGSAEKIAAAALKKLLSEFKDRNGVTPRRVRLLKKEERLIALKDRDGKPYKGLIPGENWCIDIFEQPDGSWIGAALSVFDANNGKALDEKRKGHPAARRVMRVHKGDYLQLVDDRGKTRILRVARLEVSADRLRLADHNEAGDVNERHKSDSDPFRWTFASFNRLKEMKARKVTVDAVGRVIGGAPR